MEKILVEAYNVFEGLYNNFLNKPDQRKHKNLIIYFTSNIDPTTGNPWCPHCIYADSVIKTAIEELDVKSSSQVAFATVRVGHRDEWKTASNPYRLHQLKIDCVPTLFSLVNSSRLNGRDCWDKAKVSEFFKGAVNT